MSAIYSTVAAADSYATGVSVLFNRHGPVFRSTGVANQGLWSMTLESRNRMSRRISANFRLRR